MRTLPRLLAMFRCHTLNRQLRSLRKRVDALPLPARRTLVTAVQQEMERAAQAPLPHLYADSAGDARYRPWGDGADVGYARARSDNTQMQLIGIARWYAVAWHETLDSPFAEAQRIHHQLAALLGELKRSIAPARNPFALAA